MAGKSKVSISLNRSYPVVLGSNMFFVESKIQMWAQQKSCPFDS